MSPATVPVSAAPPHQKMQSDHPRPSFAQRRSASRGAAARSLVLLAVVCFGCNPSDQAPRLPNVLVISVDTLRADHLSAFGYGRETSPFLDSLAGEGLRFDRAFAPASWTLPSHMSLLTSSYPHTHRVENEQRGLPETIPTLASLLRDAGYRTTAFVSWVYLSTSFGFGRGFDEFHELLPPPGQRGPAGHHAIKAGPFVDEVLRWAEGDRAEPFFLFLHLFDPHMSYEPPLETARVFDPTLDSLLHGDYDHLKQYIRGLHPTAARVGPAELEQAKALYDGEIRYTDAQLQRLFQELGRRGLLDNTLIVFTSDHGEEFDEHGSMEGHGWTLYEEVLRVPLIVVFPDRRGAGSSVDRVVQTIDVAPTILEALALPAPPEFEGRSLLPLAAGGDGAEWLDVAFAQTQRFNVKWSLRTERYKLIYTLDTGTNRFGVPIRGGFEMYDLQQDPGEQRDVYGERPAVARELAARLETFARSKRELTAPQPRLSNEQLERLRSLGYLGGRP